MRIFKRCLSVYAIRKNFEQIDANMGKYCRPLHRCSSVPNEMTNGVNEINTRIWQTYNLNAYDLEVNTSVSVKHSLSNRTLETSSQFNTDWNSDNFNGLIKGSCKGVVLESVVEPPSKVDMPALKVSTNRRQARAYIFDDIKEEDIAHLFEHKTNTDTEMESVHVLRGRRCALGDIFHGMDTGDTDKLFNCDFIEHNSHRRRCGLANIFNGISEEEINEISECEEIDNSLSIGCPAHCRRGRRFALGDIFINDESECDDEKLIEHTDGDIPLVSVEHSSNLNTRRFALADIFSDVTEDDLHRIIYELDPVITEHPEH